MNNRRAIFILVAIACTFASISILAQNCVPIPAGLVAWWAGENDVSDLIGGNTGSLQNGVSFVPGKVGQAFSFDGVNDHVQIPRSPSLLISNQLTVEFWMKADADNPMNTFQGLVTSDYYTIAFDGNAPIGIDFSIYVGSPATYHAISVANGGSAHVTSNQWHHVAGTYDGTKMVMYIDGQQFGVPAFVTGLIPPMQINSFMAFGSESGRTTCPSCQNSRFFKGQIDEVGIYDRALSAAEIAAIYDAGTFGKCSSPTVPYIFVQPTDITVVEGASASFSAVVGGTPPLSYQWLSNGINLTGATAATLVISNVGFSHAGVYSLSITNPLGMAISSNAFLVVTSPPPCVPLPPGLVSWWRSEANTLDQIGTNNASLQNGATYADAPVGRAFSFDGVNDYVKIPKSPGLDLTNQLSIEFWMKPASNNTLTTFQGLVTSDFYGLSITSGHQSRMGVNFFISTNNGGWYSEVADANGGGAIISSNQWHHIAGTFDGSKMKLYIDGQVWGNPMIASNAISPMLANSFLAIGSESGRTTCPSCVNSRFFKGLIDEVAIYNRALTAEEVASIYNVGFGAKCTGPTGPVLFFQPTNVTAVVGSNVVLASVAGGTAPLNYQWRFNGNNIAGATNSNLTLTYVLPSRAGLYSVRVSNALDVVTSSNANLQVVALFAYGNGTLLTNSAHSFSNLVTVQLQSAFTNGQAYYTLDGSQPSFFSTPYTGSFVVSNSVILRVLGYSADFLEYSELGPINILLPPSYTLTDSTPGGGVVVFNPPGGIYLSNTAVTVTANPASGWTFLQWLGDLPGTNNSATIAVTRNKRVQAIFGSALGTTVAGSGSVTRIPSSPLYPYGSVVTLSAVPQPGNFFGVWGNAASGSANPLYFAVTNSGQIVSSLFAPLSGGQVSLAVIPSGFGRVTVSPQANAYTNGAGVILTAVPDAGQAFLGWSGDATGGSNPLNLTMTTSKVITANFSAQPRLTANPPQDGLFPEGFRFTLNGEFGKNYQIESSTNGLVWPALMVVTNTYNQVQTTVPMSNAPIRLIRALRLP